MAGRRSYRWFMQLDTCYRKGYAAGLAGVPEDQCPYAGGRYAGGNVQVQRRAAWLRGWKRAKAGLPESDQNG